MYFCTVGLAQVALNCKGSFGFEGLFPPGGKPYAATKRRCLHSFKSALMVIDYGMYIRAFLCISLHCALDV